MKEIDELSIPANVRYTTDHEWVAAAKPYRVGVSDFAQDQLGDITFVELPQVGDDLAKGAEFGSLESIKSVSSLYCPVAGKVVAVNDALQDDPGLVNRDPYGEGWLIELDIADASAVDGLLDADAYKNELKENA